MLPRSLEPRLSARHQEAPSDQAGLEEDPTSHRSAVPGPSFPPLVPSFPNPSAHLAQRETQNSALLIPSWLVHPWKTSPHLPFREFSSAVLWSWKGQGLISRCLNVKGRQPAWSWADRVFPPLPALGVCLPEDGVQASWKKSCREMVGKRFNYFTCFSV